MTPQEIIAELKVMHPDELRELSSLIQAELGRARQGQEVLTAIRTSRKHIEDHLDHAVRETGWHSVRMLRTLIGTELSVLEKQVTALVKQR